MKIIAVLLITFAIANVIVAHRDFDISSEDESITDEVYDFDDTNEKCSVVCKLKCMVKLKYPECHEGVCYCIKKSLMT